MDLINKYIKKPVEIEAMQYIPGDDIRQAAIEWIGESCRHTFMDDSGCLQESTSIFIKTPEGELRVSPGDWIIKGTKGEFYPRKPDVFKGIYEPS